MLEEDVPTTILCDNNGAVCLAFDPAFHARVKHLDIKYHYTPERIANGNGHVARVATKDNLSDIFTKPLVKGPFLAFRSQLGLVDRSEGEEERVCVEEEC